MIFDCKVAALEEATLAKARPERRHRSGKFRCRVAAKDPDDRDGSLLRPRRKPPSRRAAEKDDEIAPPDRHSITSSARSRKASGIIKPMALAVLRLMTRSNLVGNWTGSSATLVPRRMRST